MKIYCSKCKQPTDYVDFRPKFCSNCGNNFSNVSVANINIPTKTIEKSIVIEESTKVIDNVSPFKVEIISNLRNSEDFDNLAHDKSRKLAGKRKKPKNVSKKDFTEQWKEEIANKPRHEIQGEEGE